MISPQSTIKLLNLPIDSSNKNQLYFSDIDSQLNYMNNNIIKEVANYTYVRKDNIIKIKGKIDELWNCNYVMYKNTGFNNKWFFAFITDKQYTNENVLAITLKTDVWQTWFSEIELKDSFIEREHVIDDTVGSNLVAESLELGDYINNGIVEDMTEINELCIVIITTFDLLDKSTPFREQYGRPIAGSFSGLSYYKCNFDNWIYLQGELSDVDNAGKSEGIIAIFMAPTNLFTVIPPYDINNPIALINGTTNITKQIDKNLVLLDGYEPKNKKMFTYPYNLLSITNYSGSNAVLKYEKFNSNPFTIVASANMNINQNVKCYPLNYKNITTNYDEGLLLSNYPVCAWKSGVYQNWVTQNQNQITMGGISTLLSTGVGIAAGVMSGNPLMIAGASAGGLSQIFGTIGKISDTKVLPDQARGSSNSSVNVSVNKQTFGFNKLSIDSEHAKIIDDYFTMFGYKINRVKNININSRNYWNYIKTINCNIKGSAPQEDIIEIKNIFNKGCTFWKNGNNIGDYSLDNTI